MVPFKSVSYFSKGGGRCISILDDWKILINIFPEFAFHLLNSVMLVSKYIENILKSICY